MPVLCRTCIFGGQNRLPEPVGNELGFDLMKDVWADKLSEHRARFALQRSKCLITDAFAPLKRQLSWALPVKRSASPLGGRPAAFLT
jgi:hypothetical protein